MATDELMGNALLVEATFFINVAFMALFVFATSGT